MNCQRAVDLLTGAVNDATAAERRLAREHANDCADCRRAVRSVHALRLTSLESVPQPGPALFDRVMSRATHTAPVMSDSRRPFWLGLGTGAALAAGIAVLAMVFFVSLPGGGLSPSTTPELELAVNVPKNVDISLATAEALVDAEIHVTLKGAVGLDGYADQRELTWRTNLDAGVNQLTLPIVATGANGGQVMVEVAHEGKLRTFLVDIRARA